MNTPTVLPDNLTQKNIPFSIPRLSRETVFLEEVKSIIYENIRDEQFSATTLANKLLISISQLNRRLNKSLDCSSGHLIRIYRMKYAAYLLSYNTAPIGEIAFNVGYQNQANFSRSFRKHYNCSPREYIKQNYSLHQLTAQK